MSYLGTITLTLDRLAKPAKTAKKCVPSKISSTGGQRSSASTEPTVDLFREKRCKGWWPAYREGNERELTVGLFTVCRNLLVNC